MNVILQTTGPWAEVVGQRVCESQAPLLGCGTQSNRQKGKKQSKVVGGTPNGLKGKAVTPGWPGRSGEASPT